eukprot:scaffold4502_cov119-Isochrysis_galbana.AAC.17
MPDVGRRRTRPRIAGTGQETAAQTCQMRDFRHARVEVRYGWPDATRCSLVVAHRGPSWWPIRTY